MFVCVSLPYYYAQHFVGNSSTTSGAGWAGGSQGDLHTRQLNANNKRAPQAD